MDWKILFCAFFAASCVDVAFSVRTCLVTDSDWLEYRTKFNKTYQDSETEKASRLVYATNLLQIHKHNIGYRNGSLSYRLAPNQFTDLEIRKVLEMFPKIHVNRKARTFSWKEKFSDSFDYEAEGYPNKIQDQGLKCNSGWAYATATALDMFRTRQITKANEKDNFDLNGTVSAQQFIDCAGGFNSCRGKGLNAAIHYLSSEAIPIYDTKEYPNNPHSAVAGKCVKPIISKNFVELGAHEILSDSRHKKMSFIIRNVSPIVFEFNQLSFEFFHYSEGLFLSPEGHDVGSHFMVIVGYGQNYETEFWKLQNSFGVQWGENGYIRLVKNPWKSFSKFVTYPTDLDFIKI